MNKKSPVSRSGRFAREVSADVAQFPESVSFDWRLWRHDILGSMAHAAMLQKIGIMTRPELRAIVRGLDCIGKENAAGKFRWKQVIYEFHMYLDVEVTRAGASGVPWHC